MKAAKFTINFNSDEIILLQSTAYQTSVQITLTKIIIRTGWQNEIFHTPSA